MSLSKRMKDESRRGAAALLALALTTTASMADDKAKAESAAPAKLSYDKQIRPIFQAHCQGCHQPAKAGGGYVMTSFDRLLKGGESGEPAVAPASPRRATWSTQITPHDGKAEMPRNKPPLKPAEIELISQWIAQGAVDDTPEGRRPKFDAEHPPVYTRPPVVAVVGLLARRQPAGRGRVPRGLALEGRRLGAGRPADRPFRAGRVAGVLARRQAAGRLRRQPGAAGRDPGLGRRQAKAAALGPDHVRHRLRRELVARRDQDRLRMRRQLGPGDRRQDRRAGAVHGLAQRLGRWTRSSRPTARTWSRSAATCRPS